MKWPKKNIESNVKNQSASFFETEKTPFFSQPDSQIQRSPINQEDGPDDPVLDKFSEETGLPRDSVSQHDPLYEYWITGKPLPPIITINISMDIPSSQPPVIYSDIPVKNNTWEEANFNRNTIVPSLVCIANGAQASYIKEVTLGYINPGFEFLISKQIEADMTDLSKTAPERILWRRVDNRLRQHANEHFVRYRNVISSFKAMLYTQLQGLPNRLTPIQIPKAELEKYVESLTGYYMEMFALELWKKTCDWEKTDYPRIIADVNKNQATKLSVSSLPVRCGSVPVVRKMPTLPVVVKAGAPVKPTTKPATSK